MADIIDFATRRARDAAPPEGVPAPMPGIPQHGAEPAPEALAALSNILDRAKRTGGIDASDHAAFAVYALAVLGGEWELRLRS